MSMGKNNEGYPDPTAGAAWNNIRRGERQQEAERLTVISSLIPVMKQTAERACQYLHKGSKVVIRGELHTRTYEDVQTGQNHKVTEVHADRWEFADSKPQGPFA